MSVVQLLLIKAGTQRCALPLRHVIETMRPLPTRPLANAPAFVAGASVIRGEPLPVVNLGVVLGAAIGKPTRFVLVRAGERKIALAVEEVAGIHRAAPETLASVPPLLSQAQAGIVAAIAALDEELLLVLEAARIVPDELWPC